MKFLTLVLVFFIYDGAHACSGSEEVEVGAGSVRRENQVLVVSFSEASDGGTCTTTLKDNDGIALISTAYMIAKDRYKAANGAAAIAAAQAAAQTPPPATPAAPVSQPVSFSDRIFRDSFSVGLDQLRGYIQTYTSNPKAAELGAPSKQDLEARLIRLEALLNPAVTQGQLAPEQASELGALLSEIAPSHSYERVRNCRGTRSTDGEDTAQKNLMEFLAFGNTGNWGIRNQRRRGVTRCGIPTDISYVTNMSKSEFSFSLSAVAPSRPRGGATRQ